MKKYFTIVVLFLLNTLNTFSQELSGIYWNGTDEVFASVDISTGVFSDLAVLPNVQFIMSNSTLNTSDNLYAISTDIGIILVDALDGTILTTINDAVGLGGIEFGANNNLVGVYWNGTHEIFASVDISTGIFTDLAVLPNVQFASDYSSINTSGNHYAISTDIGIIIIDALDGTILTTINDAVGLGGIEFGTDNNLVGVYWNDTHEIFASVDISTGVFSDLAVLPNVQFINGNSTLNTSDNHYAISTDLGITIIDALDGTILTTFPAVDDWKGMEFNQNHPSDVESSLIFQPIVYPNPVNQFLYVDPKINLELNIQIINNFGQIVFTSKYTESENIKIDFSKFSSGLYLIKINDHKLAKKIIKK